MKTFTEPGALRRWCAARKAAGARIALVPTMGALHDGHLSLVRVAGRRKNVETVVSIFVNPIQFGPGEDFAAYPRTANEDLAKCRAAGVAAVFMPPPSAMYAPDRSVFIDETALSKGLCGARRPGHFRGVCTVVAKLFNIVQPDFAVFGEKDYQQAQVVRRMVRDLDFPVEIVTAPIAREPSGLARSSRNTYLSPDERAAAPALHAAIAALADGRLKTTAAAAREIERAGMRVDYLECVHPETLEPLKKPAVGCRIVAAAWCGKTRLIDNVKKIASVCLAAATAAVLSGCAWFSGVAEDGSVASAVSPDGRNEIRLSLNPLAFEVLRDGKTVVAKTRISMRIEGIRLLRDAEEQTPVVTSGRVMGKFAPAVYKKSKVFESAYETVADWGRWAVRIRARDDGVAYRFETRMPGRIKVLGERAGFTVPDRDATCWVHFTGAPGMEERLCETLRARDVATDGGGKRMIYAPFAYRAAGATVAVAESDLYDYPALYFDEAETPPAGGAAFKSVFAGWPKRTYRIAGFSGTKANAVEKGGRKIIVEKHHDWLVETDGTRNFPWRVFALADAPAGLIGSDAVYALARPPAEGHDFSWVRPGKVAWDWWNAFDHKGTSKGCTTENYIRFVDFAAASGVEYVIMDEGWSEHLDIWKFHPRVDVKRVIDHANAKGVGIILWMAWAQVAGEEDRVAEHFAKLGAKGFKVDFMDRGDAEVERFLWKFAEACRKNRMLVDYHGAHRPTGMSRAYPNVLNYEGVHGLEQMKWSNGSSAILDNDVKLCFTRMTAGAMDYTPGAMDNYAIGSYPPASRKTEDGKRFISVHPGSLGTRSRQMAMMALYYAPLQMLCDSPTNYSRNKECFSFMAAVPTVWDDTVGLGGTPDTCVAAARRKGDVWYAAGIAGSKGCYFTLDTSFLGSGDWTMEIFRDAHDSDERATAYHHARFGLRAGEKFEVRMAAGGGFVARFEK